ncbi:MAG: hypothetical protein IAF94_15045 [Pirellulaceae bacterium]|nr:hypothetical protein [Pirellulaceae bacterium]
MDTITPEQLASLSPFERNRMAIPTAEWQRYIGQWVAISPDGSRIVAGDADIGCLDAKVIALGVNPEEVVFEGVPEPNSTYIWTDCFST